jgi:hypothetical protein
MYALTPIIICYQERSRKIHNGIPTALDVTKIADFNWLGIFADNHSK